MASTPPSETASGLSGAIAPALSNISFFNKPQTKPGLSGLPDLSSLSSPLNVALQKDPDLFKRMHDEQMAEIKASNPELYSQMNVTELQNQILKQGLTKKWTGEGYGSPDANAKRMAEILDSIGITDIKQFGKIPTYEQLETKYSYQGNDVVKKNDGTFVIQEPTSYDSEGYPASYKSVPVPASDVKTTYGTTVYDPEGGSLPQFAPVDSSKVIMQDGKPVVESGTTYGNKATGQVVPNTYSERQTGNAWGGTFAGDGNTGFRVQFAPDGTPYFYTTHASSNDLANMLDTPLLQAIASAGAFALGGPGAVAALQLAQGNDLDDALKAAALSYVGGELTGGLSGGSDSLISESALQAAIDAGDDVVIQKALEQYASNGLLGEALNQGLGAEALGSLVTEGMTEGTLNAITNSGAIDGLLSEGLTDGALGGTLSGAVDSPLSSAGSATPPAGAPSAPLSTVDSAAPAAQATTSPLSTPSTTAPTSPTAPTAPTSSLPPVTTVPAGSTVAPLTRAAVNPSIATKVGMALGLEGTAATAAGNALLKGSLSKAMGGDFVTGAVAGGVMSYFPPQDLGALVTAGMDKAGFEVPAGALAQKAIGNAIYGTILNGGDVGLAIKNAVATYGGEKVATSQEFNDWLKQSNITGVTAEAIRGGLSGGVSSAIRGDDIINGVVTGGAATAVSSLAKSYLTEKGMDAQKADALAKSASTFAAQKLSGQTDQNAFIAAVLAGGSVSTASRAVADINRIPVADLGGQLVIRSEISPDVLQKQFDTEGIQNAGSEDTATPIPNAGSEDTALPVGGLPTTTGTTPAQPTPPVTPEAPPPTTESPLSTVTPKPDVVTGETVSEPELPFGQSVPNAGSEDTALPIPNAGSEDTSLPIPNAGSEDTAKPVGGKSGYYDEVTGKYIESPLGGLQQPLTNETSGTGNVGDYTNTQVFDDGSTLITDKEGNVVGSTQATDYINTTGGDIERAAGATPSAPPPLSPVSPPTPVAPATPSSSSGGGYKDPEFTLTPQFLAGAPVSQGAPQGQQKLQQLFSSLTPALAAVMADRGFSPQQQQQGRAPTFEEQAAMYGYKPDSPDFFASGGNVSDNEKLTNKTQSLIDSLIPRFSVTPGMLSAAPVYDTKSRLGALTHLSQGILKSAKPLGGLAKGGLPDKYAEAAPRGHKPEFITGLTGYYANGDGTGQSDDIPAMLHDGDYVIDADAVAALGDGSSKAGAQALSKFQSIVPHRDGGPIHGNPVAAKIADGEYVFPEAFVTALGGGDNKRGSKMLDAMREELREHKRSAPTSKIPPKAKSPLDYLKMAKG